ncbi:hypothetical protein FA13DRAFT_1738632, partial [Coprinellus micaceus]
MPWDSASPRLTQKQEARSPASADFFGYQACPRLFEYIKFQDDEKVARITYCCEEIKPQSQQRIDLGETASWMHLRTGPSTRRVATSGWVMSFSHLQAPYVQP